jgi:ATP-dependent RNA helicase DHX29
VDSPSEFSDADDPGSLVPRYVSLKSRIYKIQPSLFNGSKVKKSKETVSSGDSEAEAAVASLRRKLGRLEKDILFDEHLAEEKWQEELANLRIETAETWRQNLGSPISNGPAQRPPPIAKQDRPESEEENEDGLLGDMFSLEIENAGAEGPAQAPGETTTVTKLRDFGRTTGVNPRRVLEDACKARFDHLLSMGLQIDIAKHFDE